MDFNEKVPEERQRNCGLIQWHWKLKCPEPVVRAKRAHHAVKAKSGIVVGDDIFGTDSGELASDAEEQADTEEAGEDVDLEWMAALQQAEAKGADGDTQPEDSAPAQQAKAEAKGSKRPRGRKAKTKEAKERLKTLKMAMTLER